MSTASVSEPAPPTPPPPRKLTDEEQKVVTSCSLVQGYDVTRLATLFKDIEEEMGRSE
jgi:hypothetical protein